MNEPQYRKVYIDVYTIMKKDGTVIPVQFRWEDDQKYKIDKVKFITPAASLKVGGRGIRYTVMVNGLERFFFRDEDRWFVEVPIIG